MELYEKIYVNPSFLKTDHGEIACETCHKGDSSNPNWQTAHRGIVRDPTFPDAGDTCGECHENIVKTAKNSLHFTLAPFKKVIEMRANKHDKTVFEKICKAREKHCKACNNCHGNGSLFLRKKDVGCS